MKSIEQIVDEANARGLWLNNLFQVHSHPALAVVPAQLIRWQANFRTHDMSFHEFGTGATALEALQDAYAKCDKAGKALLRTPEEVKQLREAKAAETDPFS